MNVKPIVLGGPKRKQIKQAVSSRKTREAALALIRRMEKK